MQYRDARTGAVIITDSVLSGDWELVEDNSDELTVAEIKAELDELGITYKPRASKTELLELLSQNRG